MATSSPPAGGTPARHRNLAGLWRSRQAGNSAFNHLMNLIGVLSTVEPDVVEDPAFLERSVLVDGVAPTMSPNDLLQSFRHLSVTAAVLVRDSETGQRVGLVVFSEAVDCTSATNMAPPLGFQYCVPATGAGYTPLDILGVQDNHARRLPFAELFISLIPPQYLLGDTERDFHLRCIFLRTRGPVSSVDRGASYLSRIGREVLDVRAPACAVIMQRAHNISILVYDDALSTEAAGLRAPLLHQSGLDMYDSSLIPLPAGAHALEETSLELLLLPPFLTAANDLGGRVVLLSGLETQVCDAGEVASAIQSSVPVGEIESVIVHRPLGAVLVVLRSTGDAEALVREPEESWLAAFQQQKPIQARRIQPSLRSSFSAQTFERVTKWVTLRLKALDEIAGLATGDLTGELFRLCAVRHPDVLLGRRRCFSDRAVLLLGVRPGMRETDLWFALEGFGTLEGLAIYRPRSMALGVFQSRTGAARLLLEPTGSWELTGFLDCQLALGAEVAGHILDDILNRLVYDRDYST